MKTHGTTEFRHNARVIFQDSCVFPVYGNNIKERQIATKKLFLYSYRPATENKADFLFPRVTPL